MKNKPKNPFAIKKLPKPRQEPGLVKTLVGGVVALALVKGLTSK